MAAVFGRSWEPGTAKIVAKKFKESTETAGVYEYVADVTTEAGQTFRAQLKQPRLMNHVVRLQEGDVVRAFADVRAAGGEVRPLRPRVNGKGRRPAKDSFDEAQAEPPGT